MKQFLIITGAIVAAFIIIVGIMIFVDISTREKRMLMQKIEQTKREIDQIQRSTEQMQKDREWEIERERIRSLFGPK